MRLVVAVVLLLAGLRWIWNSNPWSGPVVMRLSPAHGVHLYDWLTVVVWAASCALACPIWLRTIAVRAHPRRAEPLTASAEPRSR